MPSVVTRLVATFIVFRTDETLGYFCTLQEEFKNQGKPLTRCQTIENNQTLSKNAQLAQLITTFDQIGPHADSLVSVVGQTGWTLVFGSFAIPATVERATVGTVGENAVQTRTVGRRDWRFWRRRRRRNQLERKSTDSIGRRFDISR